MMSASEIHGGIKTFVFLDLETTGLPSPGVFPRITEISMVAVHRHNLFLPVNSYTPRVMDKLTMCVYPMTPIDPAAFNVTGLYNDNLYHVKDLDDDFISMVTTFLRRLEAPLVLVAHNGYKFDFPLLKSEFASVQNALDDSILYADSLIMFRQLDEMYGLSVPFKKKVSSPMKDLGLYISTVCKDQRCARSQTSSELADAIAQPISKAVDLDIMNNVTPMKASSRTAMTKGCLGGVKRKLFEDSNSDTKDDFVIRNPLQHTCDCHQPDNVVSPGDFTPKRSCCTACNLASSGGPPGEASELNKGALKEKLETKVEHSSLDSPKTKEYSFEAFEDNPDKCNTVSEVSSVSSKVISTRRTDSRHPVEDLADISTRPSTDRDNIVLKSCSVITEDRSNGNNGKAANSPVLHGTTKPDLHKQQTNYWEELTDENDPSDMELLVCAGHVSSDDIAAGTSSVPPPATEAEPHTSHVASGTPADGQPRASDESKNAIPSISSSGGKSSGGLPRLSYRLADLHTRILGVPPPVSHRAEDDALSLVRMFNKTAEYSIPWADKNARLLKEVPFMYEPKQRKPLPRGTFPYQKC